MCSRRRFWAWLELFGSIKSMLVENCFRDEGDSEGKNRDGTYSVMVNLNKKIPQMPPGQAEK
jgi:hypothetical protein